MRPPDIKATVAQRALNFDRLTREFPDLAQDEIALFDTLEGMDDLDVQIGRLLREARHSEAHADAIGKVIDEDRVRQRHHRERADKLKAVAMWAAETAVPPIKNIRTPECTAGIVRPQKGPVIVPDPTAVPDRFCKIERTPKKTEIGELLDIGSLEWAYRGNPTPFWQMRK